MNRSLKHNSHSAIKGWMAALLMAAALLFSAAPARAHDDGDKPGIVDPDDRYRGKTYGQWAAAWWQWALGIPAAQNPLTDTTGEFGAVGQGGPVWFLAGTFGNSAERTVTVPAGKPIFMPVHNWIFGSSVFDCDPTVPGVTCDVPELRAKAAAAATGAEVVEAWIDGDKVRNIRSYRGISPEPFSITLPSDSVIGVPAGTYSPQVADGYWLMLTPPDKGRHTIRVHVVNSVASIEYNLVIHLNVIKPAEVVPPNQRYRGRTYAEWSAKWWEWFLEYPVDNARHPHPYLDPNFDVGAFQDFDDVWFLTTSAADVTLTVPGDKALFFPLMNAEVSSLEAPPFYGANAVQQRIGAKFMADHIVNLAVTIDGTTIGPIGAYRALSPQFRFNAPTPWIYGPTGGRGTSVGDGYYVLLEPLSKGEHTIHVTGVFHFDAGEVPEFGPDPMDIPTDTTYHLKVR